jgi:hypothetical protein
MVQKGMSSSATNKSGTQAMKTKKVKYDMGKLTARSHPVSKVKIRRRVAASVLVHFFQNNARQISWRPTIHAIGRYDQKGSSSMQ